MIEFTVFGICAKITGRGSATFRIPKPAKQQKEQRMSDVTLLPRHPKFKNLTGQRFGRLLILEYAGRSGKAGHTVWNAVCDCGKTAAGQRENSRRETEETTAS